MNRKNKFFASLALGLVVILGACSGDKDGNAKSDKDAFLVISGDTVTEQGGCVLASRFSPGDKIVFRMDALDSTTNEQVKDAKLKVHLSTGEDLDMEYGNHGDADFWVVTYPITEDTPTGRLEYSVTGEYKDMKGEFKPFNVAPSLLTIVDAEGK